MISPASRAAAAKILAAVAVLAALLLAGRQAGGLLPAFVERVQALGVWGPAAFIAGYVAATVAFVPGSILTVAAGAIFGILHGTLYVYAGATIGSSAAFLIARKLARRRVEEKVRAHPRFEAIDRAVAEQGGRLVFLLRLSPVFPFNLLNYALGLTNVSFRDYLLASAGMIPGTLLYVYSGKVAGDVAAIAGGVPMERGPAYYTVLALGLAATIAVTALVTRMARRALGRRIAGREGERSVSEVRRQ